MRADEALTSSRARYPHEFTSYLYCRPSALRAAGARRGAACSSPAVLAIAVADGVAVFGAVFEHCTEYAYSSERVDDRVGYQEMPENLFVYPSDCCWQKECLGVCQHSVGIDDAPDDYQRDAAEPDDDQPVLIFASVTVAGFATPAGGQSDAQNKQHDSGATDEDVSEKEQRPAAAAAANVEDESDDQQAALLLHSIHNALNPFSANDFTELADQQEFTDDASDDGDEDDHDHRSDKSGGGAGGDERARGGGRVQVSIVTFTLEYDDAPEDCDDCAFVFEHDQDGLHGDANFVDYIDDDDDEDEDEDDDQEHDDEEHSGDEDDAAARAEAADSEDEDGDGDEEHVRDHDAADQPAEAAAAAHLQQRPLGQREVLPQPQRHH